MVILRRPSSRTTAVTPLVADWVRRTPQALAVRDPLTGESASYEELWRRSGVLARELVARGVDRGDLVMAALGRSVEFVVAVLGIVRAGAAYLPLDDQAPPERVAAILDEAGVELVICPSTPTGSDGDAWPARVRRLTVPAGGADGPPPPEVPVAGEDACYVTYTSGSTGRPKGVVVPHRGVIRLVREPNYCVVGPGDRVANVMNPAFDGTTWEIWGTLTAGGSLVVLPSATRLALDDWIALVAAERITAMVLTTSVFHLVARERPAAFGSLRDLLIGGEQLDLFAARRVLATAPPRRLVNVYGPTEATTFAATYECTAANLAEADRVPIGFPVQETTLHVLDDELLPVAVGEVGELCIGGPGVALGYLNRPALTAERFVPAPDGGSTMYRTGDLVRQRHDGALEMVGRRDRQVKVRGFRIELEEIERAAVATGLVDAAFVAKVGDGVAATLVGFALPGNDQLAAALARLLPEYMLPARWVPLTELPLGPTGKVDRAALLRLIDQPSTRSASDAPSGPRAAPSDEITGLVTGIWRELFGLDEVRDSANFIELGGNSLVAAQTAVRLGERLEIDIDPAEVLLADTAADLAEWIRAELASARTGSRP